MKVTNQKRLDATVERFWRSVAYPAAKHQPSLHSLPKGTWGSFSGSEFGEQHDVREFLAWLLDTIDMQLSNPNATGSIENMESQDQRRFNWMCEPRQVARITCQKCMWRVQNRALVTRERVPILSIPMVYGDDDKPVWQKDLKLEDLVGDMMKRSLEDFRCDRCGRKETSSTIQERKFQNAPAVLMFALSRATFSKDFRPQKDLSAVQVPEDLDVSQWLNAHEFGAGSKVTYRLSAIVSHVGRKLKSGHYKSYVRGGKDRDEWFELNDENVITTQLASFNDSDTEGLSKAKFKHRATPYLVFYERNFDDETLLRGRNPFNLNEGFKQDEKPSHWTGEEPRTMSPVYFDPPECEDQINSTGVADDTDLPKARLHVTVLIDDTTIHLPRCYIDHFDHTKERDIHIGAWLAVPKYKHAETPDPAKREWIEVDLMEAYTDAQREDIEHEEKETIKQKELQDIKKRLKTERHSKAKMEKLVDQEFQRLDQEFKSWEESRKKTLWSERWKPHQPADNDQT